MVCLTNQMILILLSVLYAAVFICSVAAERKAKAVYLPKAMFWIGAVCGGIFLVIGWIAAVQDGSMGLTICFGMFALLGMSMMLGWRNCYITYDKDGFTRHNLIGMQRGFTYDQVTGWRLNEHNPMESTLHAAGKKISFNMASGNGPDFLAAASAGYRRSHGNKKLPELSGLRKEGGGFRAHVYNPGEYLAIFIMLLAFVVGLCGWLVLDTWLPVDEKDGAQYVVEFTAWEIQEEALVLTTPQYPDQFHIIGYQDYLSGFDRLVEKCDGNTTFTVWAHHYKPDDADPYYMVHAISDEEAVYRSFEDSTAYNREFMPYALGFLGISLGLMLGLAAVIYIVGSNPQRFPKWVVYACFKKNAIDI